MTLLTVCADVAPKIGLAVPTAVATSTAREHVELLALANDMAMRISEGSDWEILTTLQTMTGDGSAVSFTLPSDYGRMLVDGQIWSSTLSAPLIHITSRDEWLGYDVQPVGRIINAWTKYGGLIYIKPALASGSTAKYFYQSNAIVVPVTGSNQSTFVLDTDVFRLPERLLMLGMVWQWKANKGLPYAEDLSTYQDALSIAVTRDGGSKSIPIGGARGRRGVDRVWPGTITP